MALTGAVDSEELDGNDYREKIFLGVCPNFVVHYDALDKGEEWTHSKEKMGPDSGRTLDELAKAERHNRLDLVHVAEDEFQFLRDSLDMHGSQNVLHGSLSILCGSPSVLHGPLSILHGSPSMLYDSPSMVYGSPSALHGSPSILHGPLSIRRSYYGNRDRVHYTVDQR